MAASISGGHMSPFEVNLTNGLKTMSEVRVQCAVTHNSLQGCLSKCIDMSQLYKDTRSDLPTKQRYKADDEEKDCLKNCSTKYEELYKRSIMNLNKQEIAQAQYKHMMNLMSQGHPGQ